MATRKVFLGMSTVNRDFAPWTLYDIELIKRDLLNEFHTRRGERVMLPNFGSIIWEVIHEPFTEGVRNQIEEDVRTIISNEPRVQLSNLNVVDFEHGLRIQIDLFYRPYNLIEPLEVIFDRRLRERT